MSAVMGERSSSLRVFEPVGEHEASPIVPSNPNSRRGRVASPIRQGRDRMDAVFVGIDVSKDRLDVHVLPSGEAFAVARNGEGLAVLNERLVGLA